MRGRRRRVGVTEKILEIRISPKDIKAVWDIKIDLRKLRSILVLKREKSKMRKL